MGDVFFFFFIIIITFFLCVCVAVVRALGHGYTHCVYQGIPTLAALGVIATPTFATKLGPLCIPLHCLLGYSCSGVGFGHTLGYL